MKRPIIIIIWLILLGLTSMSPLWEIPSSFLEQVFQGSLDPTQWFIFTALGLLPLYFLIFAHNEKQPLLRKMLYCLGLVLGGFIVFPLEILSRYKANPLTRLQLITLASLDSILILMAGWAIFFGDWSIYIQSYQTDLFVYVMTWDFIAFIIVLFYKVISQANIYFETFLKQE